jgi:peptidoglycan-associated lipoprotein
LAAAPPPAASAAKPESVAATGVLEDGSKVSFGPIYFDFDSAELRSDARSMLQSIATKMIGSPKMVLKVEGHCDELGTQEYNLALGDRRARSAATYLERLGVEPSRVTIVSYGEEKPAVAGQDPDAYQKNRRGEFGVGKL